ncbi:MAG: bifunctional hydroxymethylpyrimidine kinase/phosphomethylpyrimidine kinase [Bacteroidota bacterium]|nr:MAG: bifunctional hydroxymethylpyrimidine kinase/phosphomethylpyrimidine kinase [Bacteroidota bacterium]
MAVQHNVKQILETFRGRKIVIVGDVMVDEYLWGEVNRISPEAPVPVVACEKREFRMGGAANVAINIKKLGAEPIMCSVIGKDETARVYRSLLGLREMTDQGIVESQTRITTVKTRVIGNHQQLLRVDQEITDFISPEEEALLMARVESVLKKEKIDALIFQDYDKGVLTPNIISQVTQLANQQQIPILVDPKKRSFHRYEKVSLFKPNFKELVEGMNVSLKKSDTEGIFQQALKLHAKGIKYVMITLSERGVFISNGEKYKIFPAEVRDITDVSGAGDTVVSVAALSLAIGLSAFQAAYLANMAGGLVCEKVGVIPIEPEMLLHEDFRLPEE